MKGRAGFTLIELLVAITIMAILLTLAVVSLRSTQANARDEKRRTDTDVIARNLENFYTNGNGTSSSLGVYPGTTNVDTEAEVRQLLPNLDTSVLRAPNVASDATMSFTVATTSSTTQSPTISTYLYQPLDKNNALCLTSSAPCYKFNLYYRQEVTNTVQRITSKNQ